MPSPVRARARRRARLFSGPRAESARRAWWLVSSVALLLVAAADRAPLRARVAHAKPRSSAAALAAGKRQAGAPAPASCSDADGRPSDVAQIWFAPLAPAAAAPLRLMAVAEELRGAVEIAVTAPGGGRQRLPTTSRGGPPFSFQAAVPSAAAGVYTVELVRDGKTVACRKVTVAARKTARGAAGGARASAGAPITIPWRATRSWDRALENFYAAFVESLFDAPASESVSFPSLAPALRDPARNFFFDALGLGEDAPKGKTALAATPDCADLPYFLRAYFAWKMSLPIGFHDCDRGATGRPPRCGELITNETPLEGNAPKDTLAAVKKFFRLLANKVHSGSARTALADENTDYYPVKLSRETLRPGTVYADPFGHILVVVKWIEQATEAGGVLLAVDGQPDDSVGRKRFWEGTFLFANDVPTAGAGFKTFRPLVRTADGKLAPLGNEALRKDPRFAAFSTEQKDLARDAFYARMGQIINPRGLDAVMAYNETLAALVEQLETRVGSVENGEKYMREKGSPVIEMPSGPKIFETVGAWEDYATPSRDMRLLIALDVLTGLPARIVKHPELFNLRDRKPEVVRAEIEKLHAARSKERSIEYRRSDGSPFRVTVADAIARQAGFEMSYNPNDCAEIRWAAPEGSPEASTCKRRAPEDQRAKMAEYRTWFRERRRPSR